MTNAASDTGEHDGSGPALTLYRLEGCPFCEFVVDELDDLGLAFDSVWVEGLHSQRNEVRRVSGQRQVPVLVDDDRDAVVSESQRIIDYLQASYGGN